MVFGSMDSSSGHFLITQEDILYNIEPESGKKTPVFSWFDVALGYSDVFGRNGFENSEGNFYYRDGNLVKASRGQIPLKKYLTLAMLGDAGAEDYQNIFKSRSFACASPLLDAIIRFNNSDPELKIEIKPYIFHDDAERDRMLIELATGSNIDLIDTSLLPPGAIGSSMPVDLLSYIDADNSVSRYDFIPSLFNSMLYKGGLYEYTDSFTMLTIVTRENIYPGSGNWTGESILSLAEQHQEWSFNKQKKI